VTAATGGSTRGTARWRHLGVGLVGLVAASAVAAVLAIGVVPGRAVEASSRGAPRAADPAASR
jgi:hypothetical protein